MSESDISYEVEYIMDKKKNNNTTFYKIKWSGYPEHEATWEPAHHLSINCEGLVNDFEKKRRSLKRKQTKEKRQEKKRKKGILKQSQMTNRGGYCVKQQDQQKEEEYLDKIIDKMIKFKNKKGNKKTKGIVLRNQENGKYRSRKSNTSGRNINNWKEDNTQSYQPNNKGQVRFQYEKGVKEEDNMESKPQVIDMLESDPSVVAYEHVLKRSNHYEGSQQPKVKSNYNINKSFEKNNWNEKINNNYISILKSKNQHMKTIPLFNQHNNAVKKNKNLPMDEGKKEYKKEIKYDEDEMLRKKNQMWSILQNVKKDKTKKIKEDEIRYIIGTTKSENAMTELYRMYTHDELKQFGLDKIQDMINEMKYVGSESILSRIDDHKYESISSCREGKQEVRSNMTGKIKGINKNIIQSLQDKGEKCDTQKDIKIHESESSNNHESILSKSMYSLRKQRKIIELISSKQVESVYSDNKADQEIRKNLTLISRNLMMKKMFVVDRQEDSQLLKDSLQNNNDLSKRSFNNFNSLDEFPKNDTPDVRSQEVNRTRLRNRNQIIRKRNMHSIKTSKDQSTDCHGLDSSMYGSFVLRHSDHIEILSNIVVENQLYLKIRRLARGKNNRQIDEIIFLPPRALRKVRPDLLCQFFEDHMKFI